MCDYIVCVIVCVCCTHFLEFRGFNEIIKNKQKKQQNAVVLGNGSLIATHNSSRVWLTAHALNNKDSQVAGDGGGGGGGMGGEKHQISFYHGTCYTELQPYSKPEIFVVLQLTFIWWV